MYPPIPHLDKIFHTAEYWVYGCLVQRAATLRGWSWGGKRLAALMLILVGTGLLDEFYQKFIPTRRSDLADLMTDALAGTAGLLLYAWDARSR
ncbi:MAG: VanZ family protein [Candidatus Omnitrophica bacterium]|nr:VanZ family protein [Candidatus Omnitrophota bacterium]